MNQRSLFQIVLAVALVFTTACKKNDAVSDATGDTPQYGGTVIYGKNGPPVTLDPAFVEETESSIIVGNLFEGLIIQRAGKIALDPGLAKSWKISLDGRTYTFNLKTGLTFHDGTPFNAQSVIFTFERQKSGGEGESSSGYALWKNFNMDNIFQSIEAINDSTVKIVLQKADATFLNILSLNFLAIVSPAAVQKYGSEFSKNPVGTGPFKFVSWDADGSVRTAAFDGYWHGRPYLDTVIFRPVPDPHERWLALKSGVINMMGLPTQKDLADIEKTPGVKVTKQPGMNVAYVGMNMRKKPFDNPKVREAIVLAINKERIVREVFAQLGSQAKNPVPPTLLGHNDQIQVAPYDPERAKQLLKEAGFPNGFKCKLWGLPLVRDYMPNPPLAAELIINDLKAVGITAEEEKISNWGEFLRRRGRGEHEMSVSGWVGDAPDPHFFFYPLLDKDITKQQSSTNVSFYASEEMHNLIKRGRQTFDPNARADIYKKACEVFNKDFPWVTLAHALTIVPMRDNVMGFELHASATRRFEKTWIKQ